MNLTNEMNLENGTDTDDGKGDEKENDEEINNEENNDDDDGNKETKIQNPSEEELHGYELYCVNSTLPKEYAPDMMTFFGAADLEALRKYFYDLPWNDYCFSDRGPSDCTERITEVTEEEVEELAGKDIPTPSSFHPVFAKFSFSPREVSDGDTPLAIISMMWDLDMIRRWCIERSTLAKFTLMAKKGYKDNPYHNWKHAFCVTHFAYLLLKNLDLVETKVFTPLEALTFFISAICHDLDHRGTNNSYQAKSKSILSTLYPGESSVLENHHISQGICILQTEGCNILANLTTSEYEEFLQIMKTVIMATDVANHFGILHDLQYLAEEDAFNQNDPDHHELVLCLMITACDLSDQTKDWKSAITAAKSVYKEFFSQGDLEKVMGVVPIDMMNRDVAVVTDLQVSFVEKVAIPVYKIISTIFPNAMDPYVGILINRKKWVRLQFIFEIYREDEEEEAVDPTDLQAILNALEFEGAETNY